MLLDSPIDRLITRVIYLCLCLLTRVFVSFASRTVDITWAVVINDLRTTCSVPYPFVKIFDTEEGTKKA